MKKQRISPIQDEERQALLLRIKNLYDLVGTATEDLRSGFYGSTSLVLRQMGDDIQNILKEFFEEKENDDV